MGYPTINDVGGVHAVFHRVQGAADLGQHAAVDGAVLDQFIDPLGAKAGEYFALLVFQACHIGEQDQFLGAQHLGHFAGDEVRVDVVADTLFIYADRGDHRNEITAGDQVDDGGVDTLHFAHMADVDNFRGLQGRIVFVLSLEQHLAGLDQASILAGEADGLAAVVLDQVDDVLVDQTAEHHLYHVHGFLIGDAHALNKL